MPPGRCAAAKLVSLATAHDPFNDAMRMTMRAQSDVRAVRIRTRGVGIRAAVAAS